MASINLQGDTSGSISISAPSVAGSNTLTLPATTQTLATQNSLGVRNLIINGDMKIAQRGTSSTGQTSGGYLTVDRWNCAINTAGTWNLSQDSDVPSGQGFASSVKWDCTVADASLASGDYILFVQRIEGQNLQHLKKGTSNAESLTLSFWVKSNKTGTYVTEFRDQDNVRVNCQSYTINTADTWEKKIITITGDTTGILDNDNANSLELIMWLSAGANFTSGTLQNSWATSVNANRAVGQVNLADSTSNYINITGVQLEVGTEATPFEHRPYDMELQRCQRYYHRVVGNASDEVVIGGGGYYNTISGRAIHVFPTTMRAEPTLNYSSLSHLEVLGVNTFVPSLLVTFDGNVNNAPVVFSTSASTSGSFAVLRLENNATAYIDFDAEL